MSSEMPAMTSLVPGVKNTKKKKRAFRPVARPKQPAQVNKSPKGGVAKSPDSSFPPQQKSSAVGVASSIKVGSKLRASAISSPQKRKQATSISAGASRSVPKVPKQVTYAEDNEKSESTSDVVAEPVLKKSTALVPAVPDQANHDRDTLARLEAETPEGAKNLKFYCSSFKRPRRSRRLNGKAAETPTQQKRDDKRKSEPAPEPTGAPVVQIVDGEIVLQEESLMMPQRRTVQEVEEEFGEVVHEDATPAIVNASYNSFVTRKGPQHWTVEETKRFYEALRQLGTDFCSMEAYFEDRTRKQLKRKYKSELTKRPDLVEMALDPRYKTEIDLSVFNVEIDQKAIEAAARDDPPVYEPTDVAEKEEQPTKPISQADQWEEVYEDAAEEARDEARRKVGSVSSAPAVVSQQSNNIWPALEEEPIEEEQHDISMEDFFGNPVDDHEHESSDPIIPAMTATEPEHVATSISLIPKKANGKPKRPKFKTSARKRK